nr:amidohydrolase family protein [Acidobacteriota bacterium]
VNGILVEHDRDATSRYARRLMNLLTVVEKGDDGKWRITVENVVTLSQQDQAQMVDTVPAARLVADMDDAGIARGVVPSMAYHLARDPEEHPGERALVQAENDWTVQQVNAFPDRLVAFCSVNVLKEYSIEEMDRCARMPLVRGMKLHGCCAIDLKNPTHVEKLRRFFRAANERRMPIMVHLANDVTSISPVYGPEHARAFLEQVLPAAPDIPIQLAHMGACCAFTTGRQDEAVKVFADAIAAGNPATKNLYFDMTGSVVASTTPAALDSLAKRMRTIGLHRVLFGSDLPFGPVLAPPGPSWALFRRRMPLTDDEIRVIAGNVAPYLR